jgi:hypothetical protein
MTTMMMTMTRREFTATRRIPWATTPLRPRAVVRRPAENWSVPRICRPSSAHEMRMPTMPRSGE